MPRPHTSAGGKEPSGTNASTTTMKIIEARIVQSTARNDSQNVTPPLCCGSVPL